MAVIPARSGRLGREGIDLRAAAGRDHRRSFLNRAVDLGRDEEAVPVDDVVDVSIVDDVNTDLPTFLQAQDGAGNHAVVAIRLDRLARSKFNGHGRDMDCVINLRRGLRESREYSAERYPSGTCARQESAASKWRIHLGS